MNYKQLNRRGKSKERIGQSKTEPGAECAARVLKFDANRTLMHEIETNLILNRDEIHYI
jgi:hypothetical protein